MFVPPPSPPVEPPPGTFEWATWHIQHSFATEADQRAITDIVTAVWTSYAPSSKARVMYAAACHVRQWEGWQARLAWACIEALLKPLDDDIPF